MHRRTFTRALAAVLGVAIALPAVAACGSDDAEGHVYYLNGKAEVVDQWEQLASLYTQQTGVKVDILTATSGDYNTTLRTELGKSNAPTMVSITGYDTFSTFSDFLEPIQDSEAYANLTEAGKENSYSIGEDSYTLPYAAEWYGIIANRAILERYADQDYAVIDSADDITDYQTLKNVVESMDEHKDDLGLDGVFATPGLESSGTYRFTAHMSRLPLFYEYRDLDTTFSDTLSGTYLSNYKDLFDLQLDHNPTASSMVSTKNYDEVTSEFAQAKVAFYPNGTWAYSQIKGNDVDDDDLMMLPYYMGIEGEEEYGPVGIYDASWAVNAYASDKDRQATLDFINWLVTDEDAKAIIAKDMGFAAPYTTFGADEQPDNPLVVSASAYGKNGVTEVRSFTIPDQQWQDDLASALIEYSQGTGDWKQVDEAYVDGWATEWQTNGEALDALPEAKSFA
ncbi:ABC transporter substrate-binding protein [Bifidobacterium choloepi]|uniref:ABC transporter substrate-binding protein n=1 Tax=Bifidobacterium choloepi TaxID=2614131 RepID=A0A6I5N5N4_9BIFI|nr:ABC transporter substrate-binding protein [Bifidobacterium choloepi]NEG69081.1 ABC transporter substrate-binding protein [Bifidobacterium choloepi]